MFAQTLEKYYILLKTKACMTVNNVFCLRNVSHSSDTLVVIWISNVKFRSKIMPRSFTDCSGEMSFPNKNK